MISAPSLFLANGVFRKFAMSGGWLPLSVRLVVDLEFSALELLLMGTAIELAVLLGEVPTGVVADVFSRKWSVVAGAFLLGVAQFASGIIDEWTLFLVTQFVWGIGWTFISGAEIAWITDEVGSAEATEPLLLRQGRLQFAAVIAGVTFFLGLSLIVDLATAVMIGGGSSIAWSLFLAVTMRETGFKPATESHRDQFRATFTEGARASFKIRGLRLLGAALIIGGMAAEALDRLDVRRLEDLGLSQDTSPVAIFAIVLIAQSALGGLLLWRFEHRFAGRLVVTGFAGLLAAVGVMAVALAHIPVLGFAVIALSVQGGLLDLTDPLIGTWTNALAPDEVRATVHSFIGQTLAFGEILGGIILGTVAAVFTLPIAWTVAAGFFFAAALVSRQATTSWPTPPA